MASMFFLMKIPIIPFLQCAGAITFRRYDYYLQQAVWAAVNLPGIPHRLSSVSGVFRQILVLLRDTTLRIMKKILATLYAVSVLAASAVAQDYADSIRIYRADKHESAFANPSFPLNAADEGFLHYYEPDEAYRVSAKVEYLIGERPFRMPTYDGTSTEYIRFARLIFSLHGERDTLVAYQNTGLLADARYGDHLFVPFNDPTNDEETYGGGRYLDLSKSAISGGSVALDFNRAYNPYCAYSDGYRCPIPPPENDLAIPIRAGEKQYSGSIRQRPQPATPPSRLTESERQLILSGDTSRQFRVIQDTLQAELAVLKAVSKDVDPADELLPVLTERMYLAVTDSVHGGVGIAAPQVGINRNVIWVQRFDKADTPFECFLNPKITWRSSLLRKGREGCLSIPDTRGEVYRNYAIRLTYQDMEGRVHEEMVEGFTAVIFQHEVDHLYGILFTDRLLEQQDVPYQPLNDAVGFYVRDPSMRP